tara:strand:- start:37333 stop:38568 length:1236 start_codon:yes stop_codon:yes gene_type:complete
MFITRLESLRGIAALMVAVSHCLIVFAVNQNEMIWATPLQETQGTQAFITRLLLIPFNGGAAVTVFFVLSGYVLGLSLDRKSKSLGTCLAFYVKRLFRIYPAYLVCVSLIIFSIACFHTYTVYPDTSVWFKEWYQNPITIDNVLANYALFETNLNQVAWTLKVELVMSVVFPLAYIVSRSTGTKVNLLFLFLLIVCSLIRGLLPGSLYFMYGYVFYLGLLLPTLIEKLNQLVSLKVWNTLFLVSIACLISARSVFSPGNLFCAVLMEAVFATLLIAILADGKTNPLLSRVLDVPLVRKLGQLSYSFYIYHFIILYWLACGLLAVVSPTVTAAYPLMFGLLLAVVSVVVSYYVAFLSYHLVERPMIKCGAATAVKVSRSSGTVPNVALASQETGSISESGIESPSFSRKTEK